MSSYYVVVDSEFRDRELYPLETDFGVTFETRSSTGTYPQGQPIDPSQFFPRVAIDKNFDQQLFKIINGEITDIKVDVTSGKKYYAGVQRTTALSNNFVILYNDNIIFSDVATITIDKAFVNDYEEFQIPFIFTLTPNNEIEWIVIGYLSDTEFQTYQGYNKTRDVRLSINNSSQIIVLFDYKSNISFYKITIVEGIINTEYLNYNMINPYGNGTSALGIAAFDVYGMQLRVNNHPWGYGNIYTSGSGNIPCDMLPTNPEARNSIISDKGNSIYIGANVDNINTTVTTARLDLVSDNGDVEYIETPVYYPENYLVNNFEIYKPASKPLAFTYIFTGINYPLNDIFLSNVGREISLSRTFVVCNGYNSKYGGSTGTTIVGFELIQNRLVGRAGKTVNDNIYNIYPEVYGRNLQRVKYMNAASGASLQDIYNIPISAQNITTADFTYYSLSGANNYIFSCNHCTGPTPTGANHQSLKVYELINNTGTYVSFYVSNSQIDSGNIDFYDRRMWFREVASESFTGLYSQSTGYFEIYNISSVYNTNDHCVYFSVIASVDQFSDTTYNYQLPPGNKCILLKWNGTSLVTLAAVNPDPSTLVSIILDQPNSFFFSKILYNQFTNGIFVVTCPNYYTPVNVQTNYTLIYGDIQIMQWDGLNLNVIGKFSIYLDSKDLNPRSITSFDVYQRGERSYYIIYTLNGVYTRILEMYIVSATQIYIIDVTSLFLKNGSFNSLIWTNEKTGHEYVIGSNIELASYNINQYLNYTKSNASGIQGYINAEYVGIGKDKTYGSQNGIFYISGNKKLESQLWYPDLGDIYSVTRNYDGLNQYSLSGSQNYLNISWGSVLSSPSLIQIEHVNTVDKSDFKSVVYTTFQGEINYEGESYYLEMGNPTSEIYIVNVYNITNLQNKKYIGNSSVSYYDIWDMGPSKTVQAIPYKGYVFMLFQQMAYDNIFTFTDGICKVFYFDINNPTQSYLQVIANSNTSRRSYLEILNNVLYLIEAYDDLSNNIQINVFAFDDNLFEFNLIPLYSTTINDVDMRFISAISILDYEINNRLEISLVTTTKELNYKLYFINFTTLEVDYIFNSSILSCYNSSVVPYDYGGYSYPTYMNVCVMCQVKNEINKSYKIIIQCYNPEIQDSSNVNTLQIISLPNNILNFNLETVIVQDEKIIANVDNFLGFNCIPRISAIWNPVSKKQLLCVIEIPSQYFVIYDITGDVSSLLSSINPILNQLTYANFMVAFTPESIITFISNNRVYAAFTTILFLVKYPELEYSVSENYTSILEISDEIFAENYTLPTHTINNFSAQGKGYSVLIKLQNDGSYVKADVFGDDNKTGARYDSQNVNIAGLTLANSDLSIFTSLSWRAKLSILDNITEISQNTAITFTFDPPTSSITPTTFNGSINTTIAKTTTADMLIEYAIPIYGDLDTIPTNCQNASDQIGIVVNTKSSTTYIYTKQLRNVLSNPTIIQKILNNLSVQSSSACIFSQAGVLSWTATLQTSEPNIITNTNFIDATDSTFSMISTSNAKELQVINTNNQFQQSIYPFSGAENYIILTRFSNIGGTYLESDTFELHNLGKFTPSNLITSSGANYMITSNTITPYQETTELNYRNKDGTLGDKSIQNLRNIYYEKIIYSTPGVFTFQIPTGCFAVYVKLWGAGGGCPSESLANGWNSFGGGGGYADKTMTYPPNTTFNIKIGQASQGSQIDTGIVPFESAQGGDNSCLHSFDELNNRWNVECVAGGGGGAAGHNGGCGGAAGRYGNIPLNFPPLNIFYFGEFIAQPGSLSGGGNGGGNGAYPGSNFQTYITDYSSNLGTGGFASAQSYPGLTYDILGGAGGAGWGGGGAGYPGTTIPDLYYNETGYAFGGAGGGCYGDRTVFSFTGPLEWTPANFLDEDYQLLSPTGYLYGAGGYPFLNPYLGTYNPTGTNGLGVVYFYFYDYSGATGSANNIINLTSNYLYESSFVDRNGKLYSKLTVYDDSPDPNNLFTPYQTGDYLDMTNYYTYILGKNSVLNKNFSIRNNYYDSINNEFIVTLNSKIDTTKLLRLFTNNPQNENWQYFFISNLSKSPAYSIVEWTTGPYPNSIQVLNTSSTITEDNRYYVLAPSMSGTIITIPVTEVIIDNENVYLVLDTLDMLLTSSEYIYLVEFNESALYNLQFYPGSIGASASFQNLKFDVGETYFNVQLNRMIIPNRKIRTSPFGGLRDISDFPYIYLQMFNTTGAEGQPDKNLVNVTFTNNPNKNKPFLNPGLTDFMIPTQAGSDGLLWMTLNSSITPKIKFTPGSYTMRFRLCDPYGNTILFDNTPIKAMDGIFGNGVVDERLMKVIYEITFKKI